MDSTNKLWPKQVEDGLIPTDDAMGIMTEELSPAAEAFLASAAQAERPLLEIGGVRQRDAAGTARGRHGDRERSLGLRTGRAGGERAARGSQAARRDAGALSRRAAARRRQCRRHPRGAGAAFLRRPDGRPGVPECVPLARARRRLLRARDDAEPELLSRAAAGVRSARARRGERWPGIFDPRTVATPDWKDRVPSMVHLFEKDVLRRCAQEAGFGVETLEYFCFRHFPAKHRTDGHEYATLTARKPA